MGTVPFRGWGVPGVGGCNRHTHHRRQADTCENTSFPQTTVVGGKYNPFKGPFTLSVSVQCCDTTLAILLSLENNGVAPEWGCNPFFNLVGLTLTLTLTVNRTLKTGVWNLVQLKPVVRNNDNSNMFVGATRTSGGAAETGSGNQEIRAQAPIGGWVLSNKPFSTLKKANYEISYFS